MNFVLLQKFSIHCLAYHYQRRLLCLKRVPYQTRSRQSSKIPLTLDEGVAACLGAVLWLLRASETGTFSTVFFTALVPWTFTSLKILCSGCAYVSSSNAATMLSATLDTKESVDLSLCRDARLAPQSCLHSLSHPRLFYL